MSIASDLKVLYHLAFKPIRGKDHADRMESFYAGQAEAYDSFRKRLLQGRRELYARIDVPENGVWVEMGGGTGANLEFLEDRIRRLSKVYVVDLAGSLLAVARQRAAERGWTNVEAVEADATKFRPAIEVADVVTFSYSLTMIPDWFAAIDNAYEMLRDGGQIGVVDFYVSRKHPAEDHAHHGWLTRAAGRRGSAWTMSFRRPTICRICSGNFAHSIYTNNGPRSLTYLSFARLTTNSSVENSDEVSAACRRPSGILSPIHSET